MWSCRKLNRTQLDTLLDALYSFFYTLEPSALRHAEADAREEIVRCRTALPALPHPQADQAQQLPHHFGDDFDIGDVGLTAEDRAKVASAAGALAEWLVGWFECVSFPAS